MTRRNIIIIVIVAAIVIAAIIYYRKKNSSKPSTSGTSSTDTSTGTVNNKALRMATDYSEVTTKQDATVYSSTIVGFDSNNNIVTGSTVPASTQEIATATTKVIPSGTKLNPTQIVFFMGKDGLTVKYYQINDTDFILADAVTPSTTIGGGLMGH